MSDLTRRVRTALAAHITRYVDVDLVAGGPPVQLGALTDVVASIVRDEIATALDELTADLTWPDEDDNDDASPSPDRSLGWDLAREDDRARLRTRAREFAPSPAWRVAA